MISVGCDVGKKNFHVFLKGKNYEFENEKKGIGEFVRLCKKHTIARVVLEPTGGYERKLLNKLYECDIPVSVVNPKYVRNFAGIEKDLAKTDKIDAKALSEYGETVKPKLYEPKDPYRCELETLTNRRANLVQMKREEKQRLEKKPSKRVLQSINKHLKHLEKQIAELDSEIEQLIAENASEVAEVLQSEKGIGPQTAAVLIASLPELGHIDNRQIAKLVGTAPMAKDSGTKSGKRAIRGGRERVRTALYMASISAIRSNDKVKDFYKRLRAKGLPVKAALLAVDRKLLVILNSKMRLFYEGKDYF